MEQILDELNHYVGKITEEYLAKLNAMARELIANQEGHSDLDEKYLEKYLKEQEAAFEEMLKDKLESIKANLEDMTTGSDVIKEKAFDRIRESFGRIFKSVAEKLQSLFK